LQTLTIILIALSLSIDAFSLALAYSLINKKKKYFYISILVGIFHFFMPLLGQKIGSLFIDKIPLAPQYIIAIIFGIVLIEMIKSIKEDKEIFEFNLINGIIFAFLVSLDSFSIGIGLKLLTNNLIISCIIFSIFSCFLTYMGFVIGNFFSKKVGNVSKVIGILLLLFLIVYHLCK
jgi:putative Mn2+ efflux pump MntP